MDIPCILFIWFCLLFFCLGGILGGYLEEDEGYIIELGSAICLEEYNMDFDHYDSEGLHCKDTKAVEQYDGLNVHIKEE